MLQVFWKVTDHVVEILGPRGSDPRQLHEYYMLFLQYTVTNIVVFLKELEISQDPERPKSTTNENRALHILM